MVAGLAQVPIQQRGCVDRHGQAAAGAFACLGRIKVRARLASALCASHLVSPSPPPPPTLPRIVHLR
ncbi:unnamed protein product [Closterium sp. NIES-54]